MIQMRNALQNRKQQSEASKAIANAQTEELKGKKPVCIVDPEKFRTFYCPQQRQKTSMSMSICPDRIACLGYHNKMDKRKPETDILEFIAELNA